MIWAKKIEIDLSTAWVLKENNSILKISLKELKNIKTEAVYFSMFPVLGIGMETSKKNILSYFKDYETIIRSSKFKNFTFLGMIKTSSYNNIKKFLKNKYIITKKIYLSTFALDYFSRKEEGKEIIMYKADGIYHILLMDNGLPIFATGYHSEKQVDEFLKEFFEDGNADFLYISYKDVDYQPPVDFKNYSTIMEEGALLNATS